MAIKADSWQSPNAFRWWWWWRRELPHKNPSTDYGIIHCVRAPWWENPDLEKPYLENPYIQNPYLENPWCLMASIKLWYLVSFFKWDHTSLFLYTFCKNFLEKLQTSAGFVLGSSEYKASTLTTWPPPRPLVPKQLLHSTPKILSLKPSHQTDIIFANCVQLKTKKMICEGYRCNFIVLEIKFCQLTFNSFRLLPFSEKPDLKWIAYGTTLSFRKFGQIIKGTDQGESD